MVHRSRDGAAQLARIGVAVMVTGGVVLGGLLFVFAPFVVNVLMGPAFAPAVTVLRILSVLPILLSITHSAGLQWLLPLGLDADVSRVILYAGALNIVLAVIFAPRFAHIGMAGAVVCAEAFVSVRLVRCAWRTEGGFRASRSLASLPLA